MEAIEQKLFDLQRGFVPPAPITLSRPRYVRLTLAGRALLVLAVCLFAGAIAAMVGLTAVAQREAANRNAILERGVMTTGTVTRLWQDDDNRRKVAYRFEAAGESFTANRNVSSERRRGLTVGAPIAVRFLPDNPRVNDLGGTPDRPMPMAIPPLAATGLATLGATCVWAIRGQRRLLEDGRAAPGIVTAHKTDKSSHGKHHSMTYAFQLTSGAMATGKAGTSSKPPAIGSVVTVIYDPDRPKRSRVYPFSLVRPG
jgi:hypothetical protein